MSEQILTEWNRCPITVQGLETLGLVRRMGRKGAWAPKPCQPAAKAAQRRRDRSWDLWLPHSVVCVTQQSPRRGTSIHHDATSRWALNLASHSPVEACWTASPEIAATRPAHPLPDWACF